MNKSQTTRMLNVCYDVRQAMADCILKLKSVENLANDEDIFHITRKDLEKLKTESVLYSDSKKIRLVLVD